MLRRNFLPGITLSRSGIRGEDGTRRPGIALPVIASLFCLSLKRRRNNFRRRSFLRHCGRRLRRRLRPMAGIGAQALHPRSRRAVERWCGTAVRRRSGLRRRCFTAGRCALNETRRTGDAHLSGRRRRWRWRRTTIRRRFRLRNGSVHGLNRCSITQLLRNPGARCIDDRRRGYVCLGCRCARRSGHSFDRRRLRFAGNLRQLLLIERNAWQIGNQRRFWRNWRQHSIRVRQRKRIQCKPDQTRRARSPGERIGATNRPQKRLIHNLAHRKRRAPGERAREARMAATPCNQRPTDHHITRSSSRCASVRAFPPLLPSMRR